MYFMHACRSLSFSLSPTLSFSLSRDALPEVSTVVYEPTPPPPLPPPAQILRADNLAAKARSILPAANPKLSTAVAGSAQDEDQQAFAHRGAQGTRGLGLGHFGFRVMRFGIWIS